MLKILYVEDDERLREIFTPQISKELGPEVTTATSGNEAIKLLNQEQSFDVIISDDLMSDGNGTDLLKYVMERNIKSLFVFFTNNVGLELPPTNNLFLGIFDKKSIKPVFEEIKRAKL